MSNTEDLHGRRPGAAADRRRDAGLPGLPFWRFELVIGIWCVVIGLATVFWQRESTSDKLDLVMPVGTVEYLVAVYLVVLGVLQLALPRGRSLSGPLRRVAVADGAVSIVLGVAAAVCGAMGAEVDRFHWVVFAWALIHGGLNVGFAMLVRARYKGSQDWMIGGLLHVALALALAIVVHMQALTVMGLVGAVAVMSGVLLILGAVTARRLDRRS